MEGDPINNRLFKTYIIDYIFDVNEYSSEYNTYCKDFSIIIKIYTSLLVKIKKNPDINSDLNNKIILLLSIYGVKVYNNIWDDYLPTKEELILIDKYFSKFLSKDKNNIKYSSLIDLEELIDNLGIVILNFRQYFNRVLPRKRYIFVGVIPDKVLDSLTKLSEPAYDDKIIVEWYGKDYKQFWGINNEYETYNSIEFINISIHDITYSVLENIIERNILPSGLGKQKLYAYCLNNPLNYFETLISEVFIKAKTNDSVKNYNFKNEAGEDIDSINSKTLIKINENYLTYQKLITQLNNPSTSDYDKSYIKDKIRQLSKLFSIYDLIYTNYLFYPISIVNNSNFWLKGIPLLENEALIKNFDGLIKFNLKNINNTNLINNNLIFVTENTLQKICSPKILSNYFIDHKKNFSYNYYNFSESKDTISTENFKDIFSNNSQIYNLLKNSIKLEEFNNVDNYLTLCINNLVNNKVCNLKKIFNQFLLNSNYIAISLNYNKGDKLLKLYSPEIFYNKEGIKNIDKSVIINWYNNSKELNLHGNKVLTTLDFENYISFLIKGDIEIDESKSKKAKVLFIDDNNLNIQTEDGNYYKNPPIDVFIDKPKKLNIGESYKIYSINQPYIYIYLSSSLKINLFYSCKSIKNIVMKHILVDFCNKVNKINYIINPYINFKINISDFSPKINNQKYRFNNKLVYTINIKNKINKNIFTNLILSFNPYTKLFQKNIYRDLNIEFLDNIEGEKKWTTATILDILSDKSAKISYSHGDSTLNKDINIDEIPIRFVSDRKLSNTIIYLFNQSGKLNNIVVKEIDFYIYLFLLKKIKKEIIIKELISNFNLSSILANKIYNHYIKNRKNYDFILVNEIKIDNTNKILTITIDNIQDTNSIDECINFLSYIISFYETITNENGEFKTLDDNTYNTNFVDYLQNDKERIEPISTSKLTIVNNEEDTEEEGKDDVDEDESDIDDGDIYENILSDEDSDNDSDSEIESDEDKDEPSVDISEISTGISEDKSIEREPDENVDKSQISDINKYYDIREKTFPRFTALKRRGPKLERLNALFSDTSEDKPSDTSITKKKIIGKNCQGDGQPMTISASSKNFIDKYFSGSYGTLGKTDNDTNNIDCDGTKLINTAAKEQCRSIKIGDYWLICPKISCYYCWLSLNIDDLNPNSGNIDPQLLIANKITKKQSLDSLMNQYNNTYLDLLKYNYDKDLPSHQKNSSDYEGKTLNFKCNKFVPKDPTYKTDDWYICENCNTSLFEHNVFCPLCRRGILFERSQEKFDKIRAQYEKIYFNSDPKIWKIKNKDNNPWSSLKGRENYNNYLDIPSDYMNSQRKIINDSHELFNQNRSLKIVFKKNNNDMVRNYPAFTKAGFPCCYKTYPKTHIEQTNLYYQKIGLLEKETDEGKTLDKNDYILNDRDSIKPLRLSRLPIPLSKFFGNITINQKSEDTIGIFLRYGIEVSGDSLFSALLKIVENKLSLEDRKNIKLASNPLDEFKTILINKIDNSLFKKLYEGRLSNIFRDNNGIVPSLQNFIEYTLSTDQKYEFIYRDLILHIYGIRILVIYIDDDNLYLDCDSNLKDIKNGDEVAFILKKKFINFDNSILQLICFHYGKGINDSYYFGVDTTDDGIFSNIDNNVKLGNSIFKQLNKNSKLCNSDPDDKITGLFAFNYNNTNLDILVKNTDEVIEGVMVDDTRYITHVKFQKYPILVPIYPENYEPYSDKYRELNNSINYKYSISETLDYLNQISEINIWFTCKPKYIDYLTSQKDGVILCKNIITDNGYIIPCQTETGELNFLKEKYNIEFRQFNIDSVKRALDQYGKTPQKYNKFGKIKSYQEIIGILEKKLGDDSYNKKIISFYDNNNLGILVNNYLIHAKITKKEIKIYGLTTKKIYSVNPQEIIKTSYELYEKLDGEIPCRPYRFIMNPETKKYDKILLENGKCIPINSIEYYSKKDNKFNFIFNSIDYINLPIFTLDFKNQKYEKENPDSRINNSQHAIYKNKLYGIYKSSVSDYIEKFRLGKKFMKILSYHTIPVKSKKIILSYIINIISNNILKIVDSKSENTEAINCLSISSCINTPSCSKDEIDTENDNRKIIYLLDNILNIVYEEGIHNSDDISNYLSKLYPQRKLNKTSICRCNIPPLLYNEFIDIISEELVNMPNISNKIINNTLGYDDDYIQKINPDELILINPSNRDLERKLQERMQTNYFNNYITFGMAYKSEELITNILGNKLVPIKIKTITDKNYKVKIKETINKKIKILDKMFTMTDMEISSVSIYKLNEDEFSNLNKIIG